MRAQPGLGPADGRKSRGVHGDLAGGQRTVI